MPNYTGTVVSFSTLNLSPNDSVSFNTTQYTITITPDDGGGDITFSGVGGKNYTKGDKITYSGTQDSKGRMFYSTYV